MIVLCGIPQFSSLLHQPLHRFPSKETKKEEKKVTTCMESYSTSGKYLHRFTCTMFCHVTALFLNRFNSFFTSKLYTQWPNLSFLQIYQPSGVKCINDYIWFSSLMGDNVYESVFKVWVSWNCVSSGHHNTEQTPFSQTHSRGSRRISHQ